MKEIEIPFGAKDSELYEATYHIPEGMEAVIEGDKVVIRKKENEDERIRKALVEYFKHVRYNGLDLKTTNVDEVLDWLEKQGEQKVPVVDFKAKDWYVSKVDGKIHNIYYSVDKVQPKFNVGDWVVTSYGKVNQVITVDKDGDGFTLDDDTYFSGSWKDEYHLWSIADAKDGDVLKEDSCTFIIERMKSDGTAIIHCCLFDDGDFDLGSTLGFDVDSTYPATKEQRDLLFQKMHESGYEWDDKEKELKKIEDEEYDGEDYGIDSLWHAHRILEKTLGKVDGYQTDDGILSHKCAITAVKKLYEQKPAEWNEEDEDDLNNIIWLCNNCINGSETTWVPSQATRIKSLIERIKDTVFLQPKQEWNEEDEKMVGNIRSIIEKYAFSQSAVDVNGDLCEKIYIDADNWIKSIKQRIGGNIWHNYNDPIDVDKTILIIAPNGNSSLALWNGKALLSKTLGGGHNVLCEGDKWAYIEDLIKAQKVV